jgi:YD repeat-containing protein
MVESTLVLDEESCRRITTGTAVANVGSSPLPLLRFGFSVAANPQAPTGPMTMASRSVSLLLIVLLSTIPTDSSAFPYRNLGVALPAPSEVTNPDGTITTTEWRYNEDGKKVKITRKIKRSTQVREVSHAVAERKHWAK